MFSTYDEFGSSTALALVFVILFLIPTIFYFISLQKALEAVSPPNRQMPPWQVWLSLIPVFNFVWMFIVVNKIAQSFQLECYRLNITTVEFKPTQKIGNAKNALRLCSLIPILGMLANIGFIICWIFYWVKVNEIKSLIIANRDNIVLDAEQGIFHH